MRKTKRLFCFVAGLALLGAGLPARAADASPAKELREGESAVFQAEAPEDGIDAFIRQKLRGRQPDARELKRVSDALARRGYRWEDIKSGLRRYGAELEEE